MSSNLGLIRWLFCASGNPCTTNSFPWRVKYNVSCLRITPLHFAFNRIAMMLFPCVAYWIIVATRDLTQLIQLNKMNINSFTWKLWLMMTLDLFPIMYLAQIQLNDMAREDVCNLSWLMMGTRALRKMALKYSRNFSYKVPVKRNCCIVFAVLLFTANVFIQTISE